MVPEMNVDFYGGVQGSIKEHLMLNQEFVLYDHGVGNVHQKGLSLIKVE